jgi:hypothetical protein
MPYLPLDLKTEDDIILKCYLLLQQKDVGLDGHHYAIPNEMTEEEARFMKLCMIILSMTLPHLQFISTRPTIVMFHGNGGNVGHRIPLAAIFYKKMRCNVFMMSYRGYAQTIFTTTIPELFHLSVMVSLKDLPANEVGFLVC